MGEAHSFLGDAINVGSFMVAGTLDGEVGESEIVGEDEDDVWFRESRKSQCNQGENQESFHFLRTGLASSLRALSRESGVGTPAKL